MQIEVTQLQRNDFCPLYLFCFACWHFYWLSVSVILLNMCMPDCVKNCRSYHFEIEQKGLSEMSYWNTEKITMNRCCQLCGLFSIHVPFFKTNFMHKTTMLVGIVVLAEWNQLTLSMCGEFMGKSMREAATQYYIHKKSILLCFAFQAFGIFCPNYLQWAFCCHLRLKMYI